MQHASMGAFLNFLLFAVARDSLSFNLFENVDSERVGTIIGPPLDVVARADLDQLDWFQILVGIPFLLVLPCPLDERKRSANRVDKSISEIFGLLRTVTELVLRCVSSWVVIHAVGSFGRESKTIKCGDWDSRVLQFEVSWVDSIFSTCLEGVLEESVLLD